MDSLTKRNDGWEKFNKELGLKNEQSEMNNIVTEMKKKILEGINIRITEAEEWIRELEDRVVEITAIEQNKEWKNRRQSQRPLWQYWMDQHL